MKLISPYLIAIVLIFESFPAFSQIDATISDTSSRFPITEFSAYLQTLEPISLDSLLKCTQYFTKSKKHAVLLFDYDPYFYWFRIIIKNPQNNPRPLNLLMAPVGLYEGLLYKKVDGQWQEVAHAGFKYRFHQLSYQFTHHTFPFILEANSLDTLYISLNARSVFKSFGFALIQPKQLKIFENKIYFVFGVIVGLLLLFFILNVALALALKDRLHLWYALYIALLFLIIMKNDHLEQELLGLDSEMGYRLTPYMAIGAWAITVLMHVVQIFLKDVLRPNRLIYWSTLLFKWNAFCSGVAHAIFFYLMADHRYLNAVYSWAKTSTLLVICLIIIDCVYAIKKGNKGAIFILFGSLVFMIGSVQRLYFPTTLSFLFPPTTFHIGIILETVIISMGLIYRYWAEKKLQRETEDQIQIETIQDISRELHDNVAQQFALAKINLEMIKFHDEFPNVGKEAIQDKVNSAKSNISKALQDLRELSKILNIESTQGIDIVEKIRLVCKDVETTGLFKINFYSEGKAWQLEIKKQVHIIRIIQEVLQNVIKHSGASNIDMYLQFTEALFHIKIQDNGVGFNQLSLNSDGNGFKNINYRCLQLKAHCAIKSEPGKGTTILIDIAHNDKIMTGG